MTEKSDPFRKLMDEQLEHMRKQLKQLKPAPETEAEKRARETAYGILGFMWLAVCLAAVLGLFAVVALLWKWVLA